MPDTQTAKPDEQLNALVLNAVDFLDRSVHDLDDGNLKFSTLHFAQGIELFLKARLWIEHWTLALERPGDVKKQQLDSGSFKTVSLLMAIERLENVLGEGLGEAKLAFEGIYKDRNRAAHFHHPALPTAPRKNWRVKLHGEPEGIKKARAKAAASQCRAWHALYQLLTGRWERPFLKWSREIHGVNQQMLRMQPYLKARFEGFKLDGTLGKEAQACDACGYSAEVSTSSGDLFVFSHCRVCERRRCEVWLGCLDPACDGRVRWPGVSEGEGACEACHRSVTLPDLLRELIPPHDLSCDRPEQAFCSDCESMAAEGGTVVPIGGSEDYLCLDCLGMFRQINECQWCNERITDSDLSTFWTGCLLCDGQAGHHANRD